MGNSFLFNLDEIAEYSVVLCVRSYNQKETETESERARIFDRGGTCMRKLEFGTEEKSLGKDVRERTTGGEGIRGKRAP